MVNSSRGGDRTHDLRFMNPALYQLSYPAESSCWLAKSFLVYTKLNVLRGWELNPACEIMSLTCSRTLPRISETNSNKKWLEKQAKFKEIDLTIAAN